jgi:hypothetical protein
MDGDFFSQMLSIDNALFDNSSALNTTSEPLHESLSSQTLSFHSDSDSQPYTTFDSLGYVHLHTKDGDEHTVGRVENQEFWATPYDHTDYVGRLTSDWHILDAHGDCVGYVDHNCVVHKPDGEVVHEGSNSALNGASWMLFVGMGGRP